MRTAGKSYLRVMSLAFMGLALIGVGLWLALLSNPKRFAISVVDDRSIHFLVLGGFICTLTGLGLFLHAVRQSAGPMPARLKRSANAGVGLGFVLQLSGLFLPEIWHFPVEIGWALMLGSLPAFVWGAMNYAQGKGQSPWFGMLGLFGILGFIVLIVLPPR